MLCLAPLHQGEEIQNKLQRHFPSFEVLHLRPAKEGIQVKKGIQNKEASAQIS